MEETMKCVMNLTSKEVSRVSDSKAFALVDAGTHKFVAKKIWKETK